MRGRSKVVKRLVAGWAWRAKSANITLDQKEGGRRQEPGGTAFWDRDGRQAEEGKAVPGAGPGSGRLRGVLGRAGGQAVGAPVEQDATELRWPDRVAGSGWVRVWRRADQGQGGKYSKEPGADRVTAARRAAMAACFPSVGGRLTGSPRCFFF